MSEVRVSPDLPEHFAQLYDQEEGKFLTPLDSIGIADVDQVFELAIRTFPGRLTDFNRYKRDCHHLYWTEEWWKQYALSQGTEEDARTVNDFRNSPPQIAYVPRPIHEWIEQSQIKPPAPDLQTMRRRNLSWEVASLLLGSVARVDQARSDYVEKRHKIRIVFGCIPGITPLSMQLDEEYIEKTDEAYWKSEYESRLEGWQTLVRMHGTLPKGQRLLSRSRLSDVRAFQSRISLKYGATIPVFPENIVAA